MVVRVRRGGQGDFGATRATNVRATGIDCSMPAMIIERIVSGGQTGSDRAAIAFGLPHGGWCPKGREAENGTMHACYVLTETPGANYPQRTECNVRDSDGAVVFTLAKGRHRGLPQDHRDRAGTGQDVSAHSQGRRGRRGRAAAGFHRPSRHRGPQRRRVAGEQGAGHRGVGGGGAEGGAVRLMMPVPRKPCVGRKALHSHLPAEGSPASCWEGVNRDRRGHVRSESEYSIPTSIRRIRGSISKDSPRLRGA